MKEQKEKLYIVLISTPGIFATLIRLYTRLKYIHVVLAMDEELKEAYSFGRRNPKIPILSGFEHEEMDKVIKHFPRALCMVTEIECTKEQKENVWKRINYYKANAKRYHYTVLGLPFILLKKPFHQKRRYACSQFVARTLEDYGIRKFDKHYSLVTPRDFYEMPDKKILYVGTVEGYLDKINGYKNYIQ
ncbi:MAG: hypothetical protein ACLRVQ_02425 [Lachnospiraceae bacterium]